MPERQQESLEQQLERSHQERLALQGKPSTPKEAPKSVGDFVEKQLDHLWTMAKGVANAWPESFKAAQAILSDPKGMALLAEHPEFLAQEYKNVGKQMVKGIAEPWERLFSGDPEALYDDFTPMLLDALTVASLGGSSAARFGKLAGMPKLEAAGLKIAKIPEKLGEMVVDAPLKLVGINPQNRKILTTLEREEKALAEQLKGRLGEVLDSKFKGLADADKALLDKLAVEGGTGAELLANPQVAKALQAYRVIVKGIRERRLGEKGRNLLTNEQMERAVIKKYANRKGIDFETARNEIAALEVKPLYTPAIDLGRKEIGLFDILYGPDDVRLGKVGFLEPFKGGKKFSTDPIQYMKKAVNDFVDTEMRLKFLDRVIQTPGLVKPVARGEVRLADIMPEGIFKKYFESKARPRAAAISQLKKERGIEEAEKALLSDPVTQKYVSSISAIAAQDKTVANYLRWTFTRASGRLGAFLKVYDKIINMFRASATKLNPRWVSGNIVGDAILSVMAGEYGLHFPLMKRLLKSLPPELKATRGAFVTETGAATRFNFLAELAQQADDLVRAGIWTKEVANKFKTAGASFSSSEQTLGQFFRMVGGSVEDLSTLQSKVQLLDEQIALRVPEIQRLDAEIAALSSREEKRAASEIARLSADYQRGIGQARARIARSTESALKKEQAFQIIKRKLDDQFNAMRQRAIDKLGAEGAKRQRDIERRQALDITKISEYEAKKVALKARISEIERETKGGLKLKELSNKLDDLRSDATTLERAIAQAKAGRDRAITSAEAGIIFKFSGVPLSPDMGLVGRRGPQIAKRLSASIEEMRRSLKVIRQEWEATRREGAKLVQSYAYERSALQSELASLKPPPSQGAPASAPLRAELVYPPEYPPFYKSRGRAEIVYPAEDPAIGAINPDIIKLKNLRDQLVSEVRERMKASGEFERLIPEAQKYASIARAATDRANAFLGDYLGLGPVERGVFRRVIPFYAWTKAMAKLAVTLPFIAPKTTFFWHRYSQALMDLVGDDETPDWVAAYMPVGTTDKGLIWIRHASLSPFGSLRTGRFGDEPIPGMLQFWKQNPVIHTIFKMAGMRDEWEVEKPPPGKAWVSNGDGTVNRYRPDGMIERVIPQARFVKTLAYFFPTVQMVDQLISNYDVHKGSAINPDGTIRYPKELWQRLVELAGPKTMVKKREDIKRQDLVNRVKFLRDLKSQYRTAGPREREYIEGIFQDVMRSGIPKFKAAP